MLAPRHPPFFKALRYAQVVPETVLFGLSYLSRFVAICGLLIVLYQVTNWLKTGHWRPFTLFEGIVVSVATFQGSNVTSSGAGNSFLMWLVSPTAWLGLHRIVFWLLQGPMSLFAIVGGWVASSAFTHLGMRCLLNSRLLTLKYMGFGAPTILGGFLTAWQRLESESVGFARSFEISGTILEVTKSTVSLLLELTHAGPSEKVTLTVTVPLKPYHLVPLTLPVAEFPVSPDATEPDLFPMFICVVTLRTVEQRRYAAFAVDSMSRKL